MYSALESRVGVNSTQSTWAEGSKCSPKGLPKNADSPQEGDEVGERLSDKGLYAVY